VKKSAIVVDKSDNVATALRILKKGESIPVEIGNDKLEIILSESISEGFKFALQNINKGESVIKYGEVIGTATKDIVSGQGVHIHNVEGQKGRGDKS
jgi:altronate dehydratase small subunit